MAGMIKRMNAPQSPPVYVTISWTSLYTRTMQNTGMLNIIDQIPFIIFLWSWSRHRQMRRLLINFFIGKKSNKLFLKVMLSIGTAAIFSIG